METLLFMTPTFHAGENFTVRLGDKWWKRVDTYDIVRVAETGKELVPLFETKISGKFQFLLRYVPQYILDKEHDPSCRTREGILSAMQIAYPGIPDYDWDNQLVTVLRFDAP